MEDFGCNFYWGPLTDILMNWFCTQQPLKSKSKSDQVIPLLKNLQWLSFDLKGNGPFNGLQDSAWPGFLLHL